MNNLDKNFVFVDDEFFYQENNKAFFNYFEQLKNDLLKNKTTVKVVLNDIATFIINYHYNKQFVDEEFIYKLKTFFDFIEFLKINKIAFWWNLSYQNATLSKWIFSNLNTKYLDNIEYLTTFYKHLGKEKFNHASQTLLTEAQIEVFTSLIEFIKNNFNLDGVIIKDLFTTKANFDLNSVSKIYQKLLKFIPQQIQILFLIDQITFKKVKKQKFNWELFVLIFKTLDLNSIRNQARFLKTIFAIQMKIIFDLESILKNTSTLLFVNNQILSLVKLSKFASKSVLFKYPHLPVSKNERSIIYNPKVIQIILENIFVFLKENSIFNPQNCLVKTSYWFKVLTLTKIYSDRTIKLKINYSFKSVKTNFPKGSKSKITILPFESIPTT
ncbi:hypothetical protein [Mycoplasmopsis columboralis]|uniref:Uncharacterized protein n=1 Tax=Mycoplasmopsis columboralis TaxID=171282 RepID=A0A449B7K9_9BACT|nr:hypothetical protein [Mycoplasmopsis columboralis]VEU76568.1 Uncharacterised protein [Mycoplasmopsis columboralis]